MKSETMRTKCDSKSKSCKKCKMNKTCENKSNIYKTPSRYYNKPMFCKGMSSDCEHCKLLIENRCKISKKQRIYTMRKKLTVKNTGV